MHQWEYFKSRIAGTEGMTNGGLGLNVENGPHFERQIF